MNIYTRLQGPMGNKANRNKLNKCVEVFQVDVWDSYGCQLRVKDLTEDY